jgi:hypothetical protein
MRLIKIFLFLVLMVTLTTGGQRIINFSVEPEGRDIVISWEMTDQTGVRHFFVERGPIFDDQQYIRLNGNNPESVRPSRKYEYVDRTAYKDDGSGFYYRIAIVENDGTIFYSEPLSPLGKISSVRRTWGSIKSMFR